MEMSERRKKLSTSFLGSFYILSSAEAAAISDPRKRWIAILIDRRRWHMCAAVRTCAAIGRDASCEEMIGTNLFPVPFMGCCWFFHLHMHMWYFNASDTWPIPTVTSIMEPISDDIVCFVLKSHAIAIFWIRGGIEKKNGERHRLAIKLGRLY